MSKVIVGIDPASEGAAVVLCDNKITTVFLWKKCIRKKRKVYKVIYCNGKDKSEIVVRTSAHIGSYISSRIPVCNGIGVEDVYMGRNISTTVFLAKFSAFVSAPLIIKCGIPPQYVKPNIWRKEVLNVKKRVKREEAKYISTTKIPLICPSIKPFIKILGNYDHITDAVGIAICIYNRMKNS